MRGVKVDVDDNVDMYLEFTFTMKTESTFRPLLSDAEQQLSVESFIVTISVFIFPYFNSSKIYRQGVSNISNFFLRHRV